VIAVAPSSADGLNGVDGIVTLIRVRFAGG